VNKQNYEVITIILAVIAIILAIPGTMYTICDHLHPQQTPPSLTPTATETFTSSRDTVQSTPTPTPTPIPTVTTTIPDNESEEGLNKGSKPVNNPIPVDISQYLNWNFTTTNSSFYTYVPEGYSLVTVTINVKNEGHKQISSYQSCWKFTSNDVSYSYDSLSSISYYVLSWNFLNKDVFELMNHDINPGENSTFVLYYIVKGEPKFGNLSYDDPYVQT
jgi:hypothetical protein